MGKPDWNRMDDLIKKSYYGVNPELNMSSKIDLL